MKKLICLVLCLAMTCCLLVGCADEDITDDMDYLKDKVKDDKVEELTLDFYIIVGEGTTENATKTVELMINQELEKFKTTLDIHYVKAAEYKNEVLSALRKEDGKNADIVLIAGAEMYDVMMEEHLIANITKFYDPVSSEYKTLNTQICSALLSAVTVIEEGKNATGQTVISSSKYCVPNNHIVSQYEMFLMSIEASEYYNISNSAFKNSSAEQIKLMFEQRIAEDPAYTLDQCVKNVAGTYADYQSYLAGDEYYVKATVPEVTREEAFSSAFAIARHELDKRFEEGWEGTKQDTDTYNAYYNRCMQIIYEINTNPKVRNLLQYGKFNTSYKYDDATNTVNHDNVAASDVYVMDLLYTGDVFKAYYCDCAYHAWTAEHAAYGEIQNKEAAYYTAYTVSRVNELSDKTAVTVTGNVKSIVSPWNERTGYMSVVIEDLTSKDKTVTVNNLYTKVEVNDIITVKGTLATANNSKHINGVVYNNVDDPAPVTLTIPELLAFDAQRRVVVSGTVKEIKAEWDKEKKCMSVVIVDGDGNTVLVSALKTEVVVDDVVTVHGRTAVAESVIVIDGATATVDDPAPKQVSVLESRLMDEGRRVIVTGTVSEIVSAWDSEKGVMSVLIADENGNTVRVSVLKTEVAVDATVTVSGRIALDGKEKVISAATAVVADTESGL